MDTSALTKSIKKGGVREKLILISVFIPILGTVFSVIAALLGISIDIIFVAVVYLYILSLSTYLWNRDLQYGVLDNLAEIRQNVKLIKDEDMYSNSLGINNWYEEYGKRIKRARDEIWITQNSEQSPHRLGHEEYKTAFHILIQKSKRSDVDVSWMISSASDRKIKWMFIVLEKLHDQDNVAIAVPELDDSCRNHPLPLVQSFQIIDGSVFGIDMKYGRRDIQEGSDRGPNEDNHFYSEDTVLHEQTSRYVKRWWDYSTIINENKFINLTNLILISITESKDTKRVIEKLAETIETIINETKIDEHHIFIVLERIIESEEFDYKNEDVETVVEELLHDEEQQAELKMKIDASEGETRQSTIDELS